MKTKRVSKKLMLNKATITQLEELMLEQARGGIDLDSVYFCSVPGSDCYCGTRPPECTDWEACWV